MDSLSAAATKSRAKSCTSCRQVKLRCDARDRYPAPCSRCSARKQECRMDSNFKRVNTSGRLKPPSEMPHRAVSAETVDMPRTRLENAHLSPFEAPIDLSFGADAQSFQPNPYAQVVSPSKSLLTDETWLDLEPHPTDRNFVPSWTLGTIDVEYYVILDLYKQFQDYYYVHMPIVEPVRSLPRLHRDSPALFWAIAFTTSRHHPRHSHLYAKLREPFQQLISTLLSGTVYALKDLQALLIVCQWPLEVYSQSEDPSWMHIGFAVNAALHMGLDKLEDEVLFGHRRAKHSLSSYDPKYRRRTWMKAFQISTQCSTWLGLPPHIASASALQRLSRFYETESATELIALTEIQRQIARNITSLDDLCVTGPQMSLVYFFTQELDAIRRRFADVWSAAAEINLQGAKLWLFAHCILLADEKELGTWTQLDADQFITIILQRGHASAIELIKVITDLGIASTNNPACASKEDGGAPLLSHPKQHFRLIFHACRFLLKYLDFNTTASSADQDAARNAVSTAYQVLKQYTSREEIIRATQTIEVLGRTTVPGQRRIKSMVKTRMGASLGYNAIWTASKLRGRQHDPEFVVTAPAPVQQMQSYSGANEVDVASGVVGGDRPLGTSMSLPLAFEQYFPWGVWDDAAFDALGIQLHDGSFSDFSGVMGGL